jgi:hypothetical protein
MLMAQAQYKHGQDWPHNAPDDGNS